MVTTQLVSGIPMVSVPRFGGQGQTLVSRTPVTHAQYSPVILRHIGEGAQFVYLMRGLNGRIAVVSLNENAVRDGFGRDKFGQADAGEIVPVVGGVFLYKLVANPSPEGFAGDNQPVVMVSQVEAEGWCELSGGRLHLLSKEQTVFTLTEGGKRQFPTADGELFDANGKRQLHGQLKRREGRILRAVEGDQEYNTATCDVEARDAADNLIYPDGPFGTRLGGNVCLWAAGDLLFGGSWNDGYPEYFAGSFFGQYDPDDRRSNVGFGVGSSVRD